MWLWVRQGMIHDHERYLLFATLIRNATICRSCWLVFQKKFELGPRETTSTASVIPIKLILVQGSGRVSLGHPRSRRLSNYANYMVGIRRYQKFKSYCSRGAEVHRASGQYEEHGTCLQASEIFPTSGRQPRCFQVLQLHGRWQEAADGQRNWGVKSLWYGILRWDRRGVWGTHPAHKSLTCKPYTDPIQGSHVLATKYEKRNFTASCLVHLQSEEFAQVIHFPPLHCSSISPWCTSKMFMGQSCSNSFCKKVAASTHSQ